MKKIKLYKQLFFIGFSVIIATSCSNKNYPAKNKSPEEAAIALSDTEQLPPQVIIIADEQAKVNRDGELYFNDTNGYLYWRHCDGKYYLDAKYENRQLPKRKLVNKKKHNKLPKNKSSQTDIEDYSSL